MSVLEGKSVWIGKMGSYEELEFEGKGEQG